MQGISNDEALTFFNYIHSKSFIPGKAVWDANNHIINSFFSIQFYKIFGKDLIFLRLTNVLSFLLYAFYVFKTSQFLKNNWSKLALQIGLLTPVFLLDMFTVSRGYGMSIAFLWAAIFHFVNYFQSQSFKDNFLFWLFIALAVWSNLSLINNYLIIIGFYLIYLIYDFKNIRLSQKVLFLFPGLFVFVGAALYSNILKEKGLLYYGNQNGFVETTLSSVAQFQFGTASYSFSYVWLGLMLLFSCLVLINIRKLNFKDLFSFHNTLAALLLLNIVGVIMLNWVLKVNFPADRAAIYFVPFFIAVFVSWVDIFSEKLPSFKYSHFLILVFPIGLFQNASLQGTNLWKELYFSQEMYDVVAAEQKKSEQQLSVNAFHLFKWSWQYYNLNQSLNYLSFSPFPDTCSDIILARPVDIENHNLEAYEMIHQSDFNELSVFKRKNYLEKKLFYQNENDLSFEGGDEFYGIFKDSVITNQKRINLSFKMQVFSDEKPLKTSLIIETKRLSDEIIYYDVIPLDLLRSEWNGNQFFIERNLLTDEEDVVLLNVYFWNFYKEEFKANITALKLSTIY